MITPSPAIFWLDKPVLERSFLVWDVENISLKNLKAIQKKLNFTPEKCYAISKRYVNFQKQAYLVDNGFTILEQYLNCDADGKIIKIIGLHTLYTHLIVVSSDSDFVPSVKRFLKESTLHKVHWLVDNYNKKRICMLANIAHARLTISTLSNG